MRRILALVLCLLTAPALAQQGYDPGQKGRVSAYGQVSAPGDTPMPAGTAAAPFSMSCVSGCAGAALPSVGGAASLAVTTTSANVAFPVNTTTFPAALLLNDGASELFFNLGNNVVTATTSNAAIAVGNQICVAIGGNTNIAAITAAGSSTLRVTQASACPAIAGGPVGAGGGGGTVNQGTANTVANAWPVKVTDGTNTAAVKAASTAPVAADPAEVVAISPNTPTLPVSLTATTITNDVTVQGDVANGAADSGNPVKVGVVAHLALPTATSDGQRTNAQGDKFGRVVTTGADRALTTGCPNVTVSSTTETTLCAAGGAGVFLDLKVISCTNTSATLVRVDIRDATAGTVRLSKALAASGGGFVQPFPDVPYPQAVANNNWTIQLSAAVTDVRCDALALQNK